MPQLRAANAATFTAAVRGATDQSVYWSVKEPDGGSITPDGVYTAPATPGTYTVTATSQADVRASTSVRVAIQSICFAAAIIAAVFWSVLVLKY